MSAQATTRSSDYADKVLNYEIYRRQYLPDQLERTYHKLEALEREARRYGMEDLIRPSPACECKKPKETTHEP